MDSLDNRHVSCPSCSRLRLPDELSKCMRCGGLYCGREDCSSLCLCSIVRSFYAPADCGDCWVHKLFPDHVRTCQVAVKDVSTMKYVYHDPGKFTYPSHDLIGRTSDEVLSGCAQRQVRDADMEALVSGVVVEHSIIVDDVNGVGHRHNRRRPVCERNRLLNEAALRQKKP